MADQIKYCKGCGTQVNPSMAFCSKCGAAVGDSQDKSGRLQQTGTAVTGAIGKLSPFGRQKSVETVSPKPPVSQVQVQQPTPVAQRQQPDYYQGSEVAEKVEGMLPGEIPYVVARQSRVRPGGSLLTPAAIVATNRRVLFRNPKLFGLREDLKEIEYDKIGSVTAGKGIFGSKIVLHTAYFGDVSIDGLSRDDVHKLVDVVHWHIDAIKAKPQSQQTVVVQTAAVQQEASAVDKLKKLAELHDMGIITDDEFEEKRRKLLDEL